MRPNLASQFFGPNPPLQVLSLIGILNTIEISIPSICLTLTQTPLQIQSNHLQMLHVDFYPCIFSKHFHRQSKSYPQSPISILNLTMNLSPSQHLTTLPLADQRSTDI